MKVDNSAMAQLSDFKYSGESTRNVVFPLGGIGAGSIGLGGDGRLSDWEIYNRPGKGASNGHSHFAIRAEQNGGVLDTRVLHGPFQGSRMGDHLGPAYGSFGFGVRRSYVSGLPGFENCSLSGPYPVAKLDFADKRFPGAVQLKALSPFIPLQSKVSSLPAAMFEFTVSNTTDAPINYTLFGCLGFEFEDSAVVSLKQSDDLTAIMGRSTAAPETLQYCELALSTDCDDISYQRHAFRGSWFDTLEVYWRDITAGGQLKDRFYEGTLDDVRRNAGSPAIEHSVIGAHVTLAPGQSKTIKYSISWFAPNMSKYWISGNALLEESCCVPKVWKNFYATQWASAQAVGEAVFEEWERLSEGTKGFQFELASSTLPHAVIDAVSSNISILKSPTVLRLEDGTLYGWEGCHPDAGCCEGSCTHVWNYQQALPFLFPDLERGMREADFKNNQIAESGGMSFRLSLPVGIGTSNDRPCADGQFSNVLVTYRDWKLNGDKAWLELVWPHVKAAVSYAWHPDNFDKWDPEKTGILHGRQHHTLDMELFGPNAWLSGFYLAALKAASEMADAMGETQTSKEYDEIYQRGRVWLHEHLFNGTYFHQQIDLNDRDILSPFHTKMSGTGSNVVAGSIYDLYWNDELEQVKYQIGDGCGIDQVLSQFHSSLYGVGDVFEPEKFASAVRAIYTNNFKTRLGDVANPCRIFGLEEEAGTLICSWPVGVERPAIPAPYSQETMHGFEYAFGCQLMMIGELKKGVEVFAAVRDRYKGHNRNPFNEIECGSHYARSMTSYGALLVLSGYEFDLPKRKISFAPKVQSGGCFRSTWSTGSAWGNVSIVDGELTLKVIGGVLQLNKIGIENITSSHDDFCSDADGQRLQPTKNNYAEFCSGSGLVVRDKRISISTKPDANEL